MSPPSNQLLFELILDKTVGTVVPAGKLVKGAIKVYQMVKYVVDVMDSIKPLAQNENSRKLMANCFWSFQIHPPINKSIIETDKLIEFTSPKDSPYSSSVAKDTQCSVGHEYIQAVIATNMLEMYSEEIGEYGAEAILDLKAKDTEDWQKSRMHIFSK